MRRQGGDVAADIGVVGGFDKAPDLPPMPAVPGNPAGGHQAKHRNAKPPLQPETQPPGRNDAAQPVRRKFA